MPIGVPNYKSKHWKKTAFGVLSNLGKRKDVFNSARTALAKRFKPRASRKAQKEGKSKIQIGVVYNEGTGGQCSHYYGKKHKCYLPKHVEDALPPIVLQSNAATQLKSAVGLQNILNPLGLCQPGDVTTFTGDKISRVLYQKAEGDITINNILLSNCYMIIYDCVARKDMTNNTIGQPIQAWAQGDIDESSTPAYTYLGSTPYQTECFNQYWEIKQQTKVVLCAGGTHVHHIRLQPNRVVSSAYAQYTPTAIAGLTYYCMIEIHGSPANDTVTQTQVSVGAAAVNIVIDGERTLKQLQNAKPQILATNNLLGSFTVAEQVVNLGGSTIVTNAEG